MVEYLERKECMNFLEQVWICNYYYEQMHLLPAFFCVCNIVIANDVEVM